jgi:hypothetical protein
MARASGAAALLTPALPAATPPPSPAAGLTSKDAPWLLALALLAVPLFYGPLLRGEVLYRRDLNMLWVPQMESFVRAVAEGSLPLWDPYRAFGQPLLADPRAQIAYPPTWLNLVMRPGTYLTLYVVGHVLLAAAGLYRWLRLRGSSALAAATGAAAWETSGPLLSHGNFGHMLAAAAWMPWMFAEVDRALETPGRRGLWRVALVTAAQLLAGSPDVTMITGLGLVALAAPRLLRRGGLARLRLLAAAGALAAAVSAVQWWPMLEVVRHGVRSTMGVAERTLQSVSPPRLAEAVVPIWWNSVRLDPAALAAILDGVEPFMLSIYLGAPVLALALYGAARGSRPLAPRMAAAAIIGLLFSVGPHTPFHGAIIALTPLRLVRYPSKAMLLVSLAVAVLAGLGLDAVRARARAALAPFAVLLALCSAAHLVVRRVDWWGPRLLAPAAEGEWARAIAVNLSAIDVTLVLLALATAAVWFAPERWALAVVAAACVGDLAWRHHDLNPSAPAALFRIRPEVVDRVPGGRSARIYSYDYGLATASQKARGPLPSPYVLARAPEGWPLPAATVLGVHEALTPPTAARWGLFGSYDLDTVGFFTPAQTRLVERLRDAEDSPAHLRLLQVGGVDAVVALRPARWWADLAPVTEVSGSFRDPIRVFAVPGTRPRAYVVSGVRVVADDESSIDTLVDPAFDPAREVVLASGASAPVQERFTAAARIVEQRMSRVAIEARASGPAVLVLLGASDPGWRATVDGLRVPVLRANAIFRAVRLESGAHRVVFSYRPVSVEAGALVSLAGLMALIGLAVTAEGRPSRGDEAA